MSYLHKNGIGGILDYAAESDTDAEGGPASRQVIVLPGYSGEGLWVQGIDIAPLMACRKNHHRYLQPCRQLDVGSVYNT